MNLLVSRRVPFILFLRLHLALGLIAVISIGFAMSSTPSVEAIPGTGTLFGSTGGAGGSTLISINPVTGTAAPLGPIGFPVPSLAVQPGTGLLFAGRGLGIASIYRLNPASGAPTLVGATGLVNASVSDMDFRADGALFASVNALGAGSSGAEHLATINPLTGVATIIGPYGVCPASLPCTIEGMEAIAFDAAGVLWGALVTTRAGAGTPGLYQINTATGQATFVAPLTIPEGIASIHFACDGTLFGGTARLQPGPAAGVLVRIDPATGATTQVSPSSIAGGNSLAALAFGGECPSVTGTPTTTSTPTRTPTPTATGTPPPPLATSTPTPTGTAVLPASISLPPTRPNLGAALGAVVVGSAADRNRQVDGASIAAAQIAVPIAIAPPSTGDGGIAARD